MSVSETPQIEQDDPVLLEACKVQISHLKSGLRFANERRERAEKSEEEWRKAWEDERDLRMRQQDRMDAAIAKLYEFIGIEEPAP